MSQGNETAQASESGAEKLAVELAEARAETSRLTEELKAARVEQELVKRLDSGRSERY